MSERFMFSGFLGKEVKVPYRDGSQFKIARGVLEDEDKVFVRISGRLGTIIINKCNVERVGLAVHPDEGDRVFAESMKVKKE